MRAFFKNMIQAYAGKCDGLVYYYNPRLNRILVRPHVKPRPTDQTRKFATIATNLKALTPSDGFKNDMSVYVDLYNRKINRHATPMQNWYNAYTKMMYALAKMYRVESNIDFSLLDVRDLSPDTGLGGKVEGVDKASGYSNEFGTPNRLKSMLQVADGQSSSNGVLLYVDLSTITRAFIYDNELPCISVKRAVEAGLLSSVNGYDLLTAEM